MADAAAGIVALVDWLRSFAPAAQLTSDSRLLAAGDVFLAYPGDSADGRNFISAAVQRGARAVLFDDGDGFEWDAAPDVPHRAVAGLKQLAGPLANAWYDAPDAPMLVVAVTGTNGKTSCSQWLGRALSRQGEPTLVVGTLGTGIYRNGMAGNFSETGYTTPDAVLLQRRLAQARSSGVRALAIEASSIGIDQGRLNGLHVDIALFTNFTRDHLDYHGDMAAYEAAKRRLFDWPGLRHAVINLDDAMGRRLVDHLRSQAPAVGIIGYSIADASAGDVPVLRASDIRSSNSGTVFQLSTPQGAIQVRTQLVGHFNVSNVLGIAGVLLARGASLRAVVDLLEALQPVPGRMQQLGGQEAPLVVIDYAHTPDALVKTLATLREVAQQRHGQLWCVFGCGGERDPGKRPQMGAAATAADHVIVTSDNPRGEEPSGIIEQIIEGMKISNAMHSAPHVIEDRAAAILYAVKHAARADVVLLAGKGHETTQEIKGRKLPFLDADHAALSLAARVTMKGML
ncbi:UDP-N-acetylmuramoyl-L-alanyl-D-glutamate--2,6-diaminopimelate ligase [Noviherbaspirillum suwonense]|uniref:UDP-N-acetylmuramoyl-L-alanyl-D-glutamate--2,6-diaminopimelate ligase n=1 Tax=Noviherbaspirillum suwonense TaxID=1224511 RepID=A0ABY1QH97_9BURK|nr:UDP-N-acetylmuramoyl-L-alanyl-D-glutamate--2,6-diaminopimelate ligase [Noviherbaspirillum suwonense]SMP68562.1 UDP-N-acetylmuramoylalanyl-D-glutamate--2,6-diaminopimelate ligase [Noviherbaspirillum suwonense]